MAMSEKCFMIEDKGKEYGSYIKSGEFIWFLRETGSAESRRGTIVFLQGAPTQSYSYRVVMSEMSGYGFHCFAPDWIGFGFSDKPQPGYGFDYTEKEFHEEFNKLLDVLGGQISFFPRCSVVYLAVSSATLSQAFCQEGLGLSRLSSHLSRPMSCCCHCQLESGLSCQHHVFSSIATNLASWCGMLSLVISCTLLKGINHQFTPSAIIIRKTFMLFICETSKGQSYLVELDEHQATMKHVYHGLWKYSVGFVPFDTMKNQFLATGDAVKIIFSDVDNGYLLTTIAAEGGLPEGIMLVVSTSGNGIKILAN
ncbi:hypothetical protein ACB098_05G070000 [Castanea mollissima]